MKFLVVDDNPDLKFNNVIGRWHKTITDEHEAIEGIEVIFYEVNATKTTPEQAAKEILDLMRQEQIDLVWWDHSFGYFAPYTGKELFKAFQEISSGEFDDIIAPSSVTEVQAYLPFVNKLIGDQEFTNVDQQTGTLITLINRITEQEDSELDLK